jgi:hypothetical protein
MAAKWKFVLAVPNLVLPHERFGEVGFWKRGLTFGHQYFAIVSPEDARIAAVQASNSSVSRILHSFRDELGQSYVPSVLIESEEAPERVRSSAEAVIDFRNVVAIAVLLRSRALLCVGSRFDEPVYSETFDLHPVQVGRNGSVIVDSPGLLSSLGKSKELHFAGSPFVVRAAGRVVADERLLSALSEAWARHHIETSNQDVRFVSLFRALQIAFTALAVPNKNLGSVHDFGVMLSLWVSALEILVLPAGTANRRRVSQMLKGDPSLSTNSGLPSVDERNRELITFLGELYDALYDARNNFLHGNPLDRAVFAPQVLSVRVNLLEVAPIIFRSALAAFLSEVLPEVNQSLEKSPDLAVSHIIADAYYRHAIEHLLNNSQAG